MWGGVDVGGQRKGFHAALIDDSGLRGLANLKAVADVVEWLERSRPQVVAVDSPIAAAPDGASSREGERRLAAAVCGIRYTPERSRLSGNAYYAWIEHGLELYDALADGPWTVVECFPTASWTRWAGGRGRRTRAAWSRGALAGFTLEGVPPRLSQDERDAIGAALTARCHDGGATEPFGGIVVPVA